MRHLRNLSTLKITNYTVIIVYTMIPIIVINLVRNNCVCQKVITVHPYTRVCLNSSHSIYTYRKFHLFSCSGYYATLPARLHKHNIVSKQCNSGVSVLTSLAWEPVLIVPALINFAMQLSIAAFHSFTSVSVSAANKYVLWAVYEREHNKLMFYHLKIIH